MSTQNAKAASATKTSSPRPSSRSDSAKDEIEQIMDEIEQLQQEIDAAELTPPSAAKGVATSPATPAAAKPAQQPQRQRQQQPAATMMASVEAAPAESKAAEPAPVSDALQDFGFGSGGSESTLEDTLGDLDEEPSSGNGALDTIAGSPESVEEEEVVEEEVIEETTAQSQPEPVEEEFPDGVQDEVISASDSNLNGDEPQFEEEEVGETLQEMSMSTGQRKDTDAASASEGSLTMTLKGSMTLKLQYDFDGQVVTVGFSDGCLKIELADGTEFKVPVHSRRAQNLRRVA